MSLKKILTATLENEEKLSKVLYSSESTHQKISLLANIFDTTKNQIVENIIRNFFSENNEEIKDRITLKKQQLDDIF